jgi:hypothetical protein
MAANAFAVVPRIATNRFDSQHHMSDPESENESLQVLRSLVEFHHGTWTGHATSFSVTADVAAGILQRKVSPEYKTSVRVGLVNGRELSMTETFQWDDKMSSRTLSLLQSNMDVDSVDASYSLDTSLPDIPSAITGTNKLLHFGIEHCIAVNDQARVRCLAFYGVDLALARVVVLHEQKVTTDAQSTQEDLLPMSSDIDRIIVDKITGQVAGNNSSDSAVMKESPQERMEKLQTMSSSTQQQDNALSLHPMSLLELTSGVWLGDSIVRDLPSVPSTPFKGGFGFAAANVEFGSWDIGVQKTAWRWIWDYGESIRQQDDVGKAMGSAMAEELSQSLSGTVCVNESLSRRIPKNERMVYMDWNNGDHVGFLLGSVSIQVRFEYRLAVSAIVLMIHAHTIYRNIAAPEIYYI